ncbi:MAG: hypothetical protein ABIJ42_09420 [Acidobacteriota bacterium]
MKLALDGVDLSRLDVVRAAGAAGMEGISWTIEELKNFDCIQPAFLTG